jgi:hypothetical protein
VVSIKDYICVTFFRFYGIYDKKMKSGAYSMRRIFVALLVYSCLLISDILPTALSYAEKSISNLPIVAEDAAVFYLVPHQLTAELNKFSISLDSVSIKAAPLLKKNNNLFFPFKWLETAHLATIKWGAKTGSTWADFDAENSVPFPSLRLMPNQSKIFRYSDGTMTALDESIPKTFMKNGQLYIPLSLLPKMGINYTWRNGVMHWVWNDKVVKVLHPTYTTDKENITFSALVQKEFGHTGHRGMTSSIGGGISTTISLSGEEQKAYIRSYRGSPTTGSGSIMPVNVPFSANTKLCTPQSP